MLKQLISQAPLDNFAVKVESAMVPCILLALIVAAVGRYTLLSMVALCITCSRLRRFATFLPSIYLYNQKQTKLFAFVII